MKAKFWILFLLNLTCLLVRSETEGEERDAKVEEDAAVRSATATYNDILDGSLKMITGKLEDPIKIRKFLNKHFFTNKVTMSIWAKAIKETELFYNFEFQEYDLAVLQDTLRNIYKNILDCDGDLERSVKKKKHLIQHSKCYTNIHAIIVAGQVEFGLPTGSEVGQARILSINIAYNLMKLLFLQMTQNLVMNVGLNPLAITKPIIDSAVEMINQYENVGSSVNSTRLSAIGTVRVCTEATFFFNEFDDNCSPEPVKQDMLLYVGGSTSALFEKQIKVSVKDTMSGTDVCSMEMKTTPQNPKEKIASEMKAKCEKARASYTNKIDRKIQEYLSERTQKIIKALPTLWGRSKKKLKVNETKSHPPKK